MKEQLYFFHTMPLSQVKRGPMVPHPVYSDKEYLPAYQWLEKEKGFFPLFLAVGTEEAAYVTGYQNQWRVFLGNDHVDGAWRKVYRKAGEFPNYALFGFAVENVEGYFTDYQWWNIVLGDCMNGTPVDKHVRRMLFKKSWPRSKWLATARRDGHLVQLIAPSLDLAKASVVWARNKESAAKLREMGFDNVQVKRLPLETD